VTLDRSRSPFAAALLAFAIGGCARTTAVPSHVEPGDRPVTLRYLGVAGWELTDGEHTLLVDPYFSRRKVEDDAAPITPDLEAIHRYAPKRADVVLVGHSHYDHLLDTPTIATDSGAHVVGTESTIHVARASGVAEDKLVVARGGETFAFGPFSVRAIRGLHSLTGQPPATIPGDITLPMSADAYGEGGTLQYLVRFAGRSILFIGTANFIEEEIAGLRPDVAVVAVGLRHKIPDYSCRLMRGLGAPPLVLANHFDAFMNPLEHGPMDIGESGHAGLSAFADEVHACAPATHVVVPVHLRPIPLERPRHAPED
jgi:L-ascorbate metabolism protein UlaG (beta-lactamase superfamily)